MAELLGAGLAFPLQVDRLGGIALSHDERDVDQAIELIPRALGVLAPA